MTLAANIYRDLIGHDQVSGLTANFAYGHQLLSSISPKARDVNGNVNCGKWRFDLALAAFHLTNTGGCE